MRTIKIVSGVYGHRENGRTEAKTVHDPPFQVEEKKAERLVGLGVAEIVDGVVLEAEKPDLSDEGFYHVEMKAAELKEVMDEYGVPFKVGMTKADMVAALDGAFEEIPEFGAEEPVL